jgi:hypothetical protein
VPNRVVTGKLKDVRGHDLAGEWGLRNGSVRILWPKRAAGSCLEAAATGQTGQD